MRKLSQISFAVSSGESYSQKNNASNLVNLYAHATEPGSKSNHILINTPGLELIIDAGEHIFGTYEFLGVIYVATAAGLYSYNEAFRTLDLIGEVAFNKKVVFADNGIDMVFVAGNGYSFTPGTGVFKSMEQEGWYPSDTVAYMDGYFIFNRTGTGQFFVSKLYSTEVDPLDWATGEAAPDDTVGVVVANRQLWIIGEKTSEVWYDSGDPLFPFTRVAGAVAQIGCFNYKTIAEITGSLFFVSQDFKVYQTTGYSPVPISTPGVEHKIKQAGREDLRGFTYFDEGHWFYALTIDDDTTMVYDPSVAQWHIRSSISTGRWKIEGAINVYATGSVVGYGGTKFYRMSIDHYTDDGDVIRREAVSVPINKTVNRIRISELQLDCEVALDINAKVGMQTSGDGGVTWSNTNEAFTGKTGTYKNRVRWLRLGQFRDAIIKIVITEPIPIRIIGLWARIM